MSSERRFSHPGDDEAFVRRCRIVAVAVVRLVAVYFGWGGLYGASYAVESMLTASAFGGGMSAGWIRILPLALSVVSSIVLWFGAGWLSRRFLPMPPSRSQCPKCKYPIGEIEGETCPECGARVR